MYSFVFLSLLTYITTGIIQRSRTPDKNHWGSNLRKQSGAGHESEKRSKHAPRAGKSEEEKRENRAERGMRVRKEAIMPRGQGKVKRKSMKTEPSGA